MNPTDFLLLFFSLAFAVIALLAHGWTLHGIGPVLLASTPLIIWLPAYARAAESNGLVS
jgi:hypothetical protein